MRRTQRELLLVLFTLRTLAQVDFAIVAATHSVKLAGQQGLCYRGSIVETQQGHALWVHLGEGAILEGTPSDADPQALKIFRPLDVGGLGSDQDGGLAGIGIR